jgi:hypothetical protein
VTRYRCVAARKAEGFNVVDACDAAGVSRSAFYAWLERPEGPTEAEWDEAHLINEIVDIHPPRRAPTASRASPPSWPTRAGWSTASAPPG